MHYLAFYQLHWMYQCKQKKVHFIWDHEWLCSQIPNNFENVFSLNLCFNMYNIRASSSLFSVTLWLKAAWKGNDLFGFYFLMTSQHWERSQQELNQRPRRTTAYWHHSDFFSFLIYHTTTCLEMVQSIDEWALLYQLETKKNHHRHVHMPI